MHELPSQAFDDSRSTHSDVTHEIYGKPSRSFLDAVANPIQHPNAVTSIPQVTATNKPATIIHAGTICAHTPTQQILTSSVISPDIHDILLSVRDVTRPD